MQTNAWKFPASDFPAFLKVLGTIRELGYEGFETGFRNVEGMFGKKSKDARAEISATGLRFLGCHIFLSNYDAKTNTVPMEKIDGSCCG